MDIKSGAAAKEAALQTAGYAVMAFPECPEKVQRCTVEIHAEGHLARRRGTPIPGHRRMEGRCRSVEVDEQKEVIMPQRIQRKHTEG